MRLVVIPDISYPKFEKIRNALYQKIPFALISNTYCNTTGYLQFWDEAYVPEALRKFITAPPNQKLMEELNALFKDFIF